MIAMTARDLPEIRARMTEWVRDPGTDGAGNWFRFFLGPAPQGTANSCAFTRVDDVGATIAGALEVQLPAAELFFVSADMTDLACHAADTLINYRLHPDDLPAPIGVMAFEHPPVGGTAAARHDAVSIVSWGRGEVACGCTPGRRHLTRRKTSSTSGAHRHGRRAKRFSSGHEKRLRATFPSRRPRTSLSTTRRPPSSS